MRARVRMDARAFMVDPIIGKAGTPRGGGILSDNAPGRCIATVPARRQDLPASQCR